MKENYEANRTNCGKYLCNDAQLKKYTHTQKQNDRFNERFLFQKDNRQEEGICSI